MYEQLSLAPAGSVGNVTGAGVDIDPYDSLSFQFVVEVAGATPTVTWKVQASPSAPGVSDANAAWYDVGYITDATDTIATATRTATAVGAQIQFVSNPVARKYRRFRIVTSANTNITFRVEAYRVR